MKDALHFCNFGKKKVVQEALYYEKQEGEKVRCVLCPWYCILKPGQTGACKVRRNASGKLETLVGNRIAALGTDPIEKKPLYHFYPGRYILSAGSVGCNLHCTFCQNHNISQCRADEFQGFIEISPEELLNKARSITRNIGVAYTYNEPFTFYEYMMRSAQLIHAAGLKNVVVSNGYVNPGPLNEILPYIDAFNIDLKAFDENFYRQQTTGKLKPVLDTISAIARSNAHIEITTLVIPGLNDDEYRFEEMVKWIADQAGPGTPLHLSRYFPQYRLMIQATPVELLGRLHRIAKKHLQYVYTGNVDAGACSDTRCPECNRLLVQRSRYTVSIEPGFRGTCPRCGSKIPIVL